MKKLALIFLTYRISNMTLSSRTACLTNLAKIFFPQKHSYTFYHEKVIDHYENPRNAGSLDKNDQSVGTGIVGAPACGDVMKLQIKVMFF